WLGEHGSKIAKQGYDVILTPYQYLYLEMAYRSDPKEPGEYWGGYVDTFKIYSFMPITPDMPSELAQKVKGIEGGIWTEYINSQERFDYIVFPKFAALAEVAWSQAAQRNWQNFSARLGYLHLPRLDHVGVLYRLPPPGFTITDKLNANVEFPGLTLRYTLDG